MGSAADFTDDTEPHLAALDGGPMDGTTYSVEPDVCEVRITMADRSRHLYERTTEFGPGPDGGSGPMFRWMGRF